MTGVQHLEQNTYVLLVINPGSTSTKIGVFENERLIFEETLRHELEELERYHSVFEQYQIRKQVIMKALQKRGFDLQKLNGIVGRGGVLRPISGGTYRVNQAMLNDLQSGKYGEHASNLGGIIAHEMAIQLDIPAFIVDPVVVDELQPIARFSGIPELKRRSIFHALNQKAVARRTAKQLGKSYENARFIVCHMGGGITVGAHEHGRVIDVNNGLNGDGPFSPERAGSVPIGDLITMCYSGEYYSEEIVKKLVGQGGLVAYLGTNDAKKVEKMITDGSEQAKLVYEAMAYQVAKEIGAAAVVLKGQVDAVILTGGLAYGDSFIQLISQRIEWIAPIIVIPGENELEALAEGGLRVLRGEEQEQEYPYS